MYRKNVASQFLSFQGVDATTGGIKSGVSWTVRRCIDGTFAAGGGTVTEDSTNGWYKYAMSQADTNGNDISFNFTGTGAVPQTVNILTTACDPSVATNFGITGIPAVASGGAGAIPTTDASGRVSANTTQIGGQTASASGTVTFPNATLASTTNITTVGAVSGAVGSVTGNVGGNVTGSVGSVVAGVNLTSIAGAPVAVDTGTAGTVSFTSGAYVAVQGGTVNANVTQWLGENVQAQTDGIPIVSVSKVYNPTTDAYENLSLDAAGDISANVKKVNDVSVGGVGSSGDPWGPA